MALTGQNSINLREAAPPALLSPAPRAVSYHEDFPDSIPNASFGKSSAFLLYPSKPAYPLRWIFSVQAYTYQADSTADSSAQGIRLPYIRTFHQEIAQN